MRQVTLPKWPALTVLGTPVTQEQAAEIIIRTNDWGSSCNDPDWEMTVWQTAGFEIKKHSPNLIEIPWDSRHRTEKELRVLSLNYLCNYRIMSNWIGGTHGWCDWNGDIRSCNYNIGKWPTEQEVLDEWKAIAYHFPFLSLRAQLWSGEASGEGIYPVCEFVVRGGRASQVEPDGRVLRPEYLEINAGVLSLNREHGCDQETLEKAVSLVRAA